MRALFYISNLIGGDDILYGLLQIGIDADRSNLVVDLDDVVDEQIEQIEREIKEVDFVITRSFSVNVAEACHNICIPYIAWCYDSPVRALYSREAFYKTNYIFVFDRKQLERMRELGLPHVYHQPLAANMIKASKVRITDNDLKTHSRDISFIGRTYNKGYYSLLSENMPETYIDQCEHLFNEHLCIWNGNTIFDELSSMVIEAFYNKLSKDGRERYCISDRYLTEVLILVNELTFRERIEILNESSRKFQTIVHTYEPERYKDLIGAILCPPVGELSDELYRIYAAAKINLNITMRSIETGVPQRVYDIMSVGGCVFSNYQKEAEVLFEPDRDIVLFKSMDEFTDKAEYYISHEKQRLEIGARAYLKVRDKYNYPNAIKSMIDRL